MKIVKYKRSAIGEARRLKALAKKTSKNKHWKWTINPNLATLHKRINKIGGSAKNFKCKCGKQAVDWALVGKKYTDKLKDYEPKCRKCHVNFDKSWKKRGVIIIERNAKGQIVKAQSYAK